jgi:hypothetical protein
MDLNTFNNLSFEEKNELYNQFVTDWQDEYGERPSDYVPNEDSYDFEEWIKVN